MSPRDRGVYCEGALAQKTLRLRAVAFARKCAPTICVALAAMNFAFAQVAAPTDANLEEQVKALSSELRCLVCQNQTVADSDAPVARDMRDQVRAQLAAGKSHAEVKRYMTERFGDFVLYKPAFNASTLLLWLGPFAVLAWGAFILLRRLRANARIAEHAHASPLSDEQRQRARALLAIDDSTK